MKKTTLFLAIVIAAATVVPAQDKKSTAPVNWQTYRISKIGVSVLMPKMPLVIKASSSCNQLETASYFSYARGAVYQLRIAQKGGNIPEYCPVKKVFGKRTFDERLAELRRLNEAREENATVNGRAATKVSTRTTTYYVIEDLGADRWIELAISGRPDTLDEEGRFLNSLSLSASEGIEIGGGAERMLGDPDIPLQQEAKGAAGADLKTEHLTIVAKSQPSYTDAARQANVMGRVRLRVTFQADGAIGDISVLEGLSHGLTNQAIEAAKRMVFLPARQNGKPVSATRTVEMSFSIF